MPISKVANVYGNLHLVSECKWILLRTCIVLSFSSKRRRVTETNMTCLVTNHLNSLYDTFHIFHLLIAQVLSQSPHFWNRWTEEYLVWSFGHMCLTKTYQQILQLSDFGAKVCLKCIWHEKYFLLIWKAFQNTEEWHFSFWNTSFRFRDIDVFLLCKLDQWWRHIVCN